MSKYEGRCSGMADKRVGTLARRYVIQIMKDQQNLGANLGGDFLLPFGKIYIIFIVLQNKGISYTNCPMMT